MKAKANNSSSQTGDTNTSTRKISPSNCFVPGKNSPAYRINTHLRTYKAILTCPTRKFMHAETLAHKTIVFSEREVFKVVVMVTYNNFLRIFLQMKNLLKISL
jgi:hypothetical protein